MGNSSSILAKYDVSGIQSYIFATNRLRENIGASRNVGNIMKKFLVEAIWETGRKYPDKKVVTEWKTKDGNALPFQMKNDRKVQIEIVYIGGGNALVLFEEEELYNDVSRILAETTVKNCRGVTLLTAHVKADFTDFAGSIQKLDRKMEERKWHARRIVTCSAYPIVEQDPSYGLPITHTIVSGEEKRNVSAVQYEKWLACKEEDKGVEKERYAVQMSDLILKKGEESYVAVIHIDGNGMGAMVQDVLKKYRSFERAIPEMRKLSEQIEGRNTTAFKRMIERLKGCTDKEKLPIRLLLQDGDDLTFICRADLGLCAAVGFMRELLEANQGERELSACAGIAFVHSHFPFQLACQIAETCCEYAKKEWYKRGNRQTCFLDFEVVRGAYVEQAKQREREKEITRRPFYIKAQEDKTGETSIAGFFEILNRMTAEGKTEKEWPANRLRRLYEGYLQGEDAVRELEREYAARGYDLSQLSGQDTFSLKSGVFDALQVLDFYDRKIQEHFWKMWEAEDEG